MVGTLEHRVSYDSGDDRVYPTEQKVARRSLVDLQTRNQPAHDQNREPIFKTLLEPAASTTLLNHKTVVGILFAIGMEIPDEVKFLNLGIRF